MRVLVFVKASKESESGVPPSMALAQAMGKYNEELIQAGILKDGDGLHPTSRAKRIHFDGSQRTVIDGPFPQNNELVAGYWVWEVKDMDEAVAWAKKCPNPMPTPSDLELRPVISEADFAEMMAQATP